MIFVAAGDGETVFLMLSEQDVAGMRAGSTRFVDERQTGGLKFSRAVLSLSKSDVESLKLIRQAGHAVDHPLVEPGPGPAESRCAGCNGLIATPLMFEGKCTVCWATLAKQLQTARN
jgi:hypothetical protein